MPHAIRIRLAVGCFATGAGSPNTSATGEVRSAPQYGHTSLPELIAASHSRQVYIERQS
jgi:hypothetical protein